MQGTRKIATMKGRSSKLVDLPAGAKPERSLRRKQTANAVNEAINFNQSEFTLNKEEDTTMAMTNKQATARALKSDVTVMPEGMEEHRDLVKQIHAAPVDFLVKHYPTVDDETITDLGKSELAIAELTVKHKSGKGPNVVGEWIEVFGMTNAEREETVEKAMDLIRNGTQESKNIFETVDNENGFARRRQVAVFSSLAATALVGGAKMLMSEDFGKTEILKTVAGAAISGTVTTVAMNALSDKELGNVESAGIGAGIGLVVGGTLSFGLDMFSSKSEESEGTLELPAPAEA